MPNLTADRLKNNIDKILSIWEERVNKEIKAAKHQDTKDLRNSLPTYLLQVVDALSNTIDRTSARKSSDKVNSTRVGKKHGEDRAGSKNYTIDQLITEYHILRQVLFDVIEEEAPITDVEREVIVCSIEQAVNDAATEYSDILKGLKEKISSTLTHDLRTPLTSTRLIAQLILRKLESDDALVPKLKNIIKNMERADQMISGLLDASRLEAGQNMSVEFKECDLVQIVRQVAEDLSLSHQDSIIIQSEKKCEGYWDEDGLHRIIENLITNAIKYGDERSSITISLSQDETSAELRVHNFGNPISPEEIPLLFKQYSRLKSSQNKAGWGLGLTMVKGMVEAHKGSVTVESKENEGTSFIVRLPKHIRTDIIPGKVPGADKFHEEAPQIQKE